jgi:DNA-binding NarL/FixJ family response regulator
VTDARGRALLVGGDLLAQGRLRAAADELRVTLHTATADTMRARLAGVEPDVLILDLDSEAAILEELAAARAEGVVPERVVGYFSHVNEALGETARRAGVEAVPRGRFWRTLPDHLRARRIP